MIFTGMELAIGGVLGLAVLALAIFLLIVSFWIAQAILESVFDLIRSTKSTLIGGLVNLPSAMMRGLRNL
jgi:hypothetical protein